MALELTNEQLSVNSALIFAQNADLQNKWSMIVTADSSAAVSIAYMDGSMSKFATNASVGLAFLTNASLGNISQRVGLLDVSIKNFATNASVGLALGPFATNASVNSALLTNASLGNISGRVTILDTSIKNYATNASVGLALGAYATNASVGTANFTTNASVAKFTTNASIATASFVTNSSLASGTVVKEYIPGTDYRIGLKDSSGVNGSMFVKNSSIYLKINNYWTMFACVSMGLG